MSLRTAIHAVRTAGLAVVKTGKITGGINAHFAKYADVWTALEPALKANGLTVGWKSGAIRRDGDMEMQSMTMIVSDGTEEIEHGFEILLPEKLISSRGGVIVNNAQRQANAKSYGRRTELINFFNVATGDEDEVERMKPGDARATGPQVSDRAHWSALMQGGWCEIAGPDGVAIDELTDKQKLDLWQKDPENKALMAWCADRIQNRLEDGGWAWAKFVEWSGLTLPGSLQECNAGQLREAAVKSKQLPE